MSDIFISYSRKDKEFVERLTQALKDQGLEVWVDLEDIRLGEDWKDRIFWGIAGAGVFIFLISPDSVESKMCNEEIAKAIEYGKRISPIYIRETAIETIPPDIRKINWISCKYEKVEANIVVSDDFNSAIAKIVEAVRLDNDWLRFQKDLQLRILKWEKSKYKKGFLLHGENLEETKKYFDANKNKEPYQTELQKHYIKISRIEEDKRNSRQRILRLSLGGIAIFAIIATCLAALFGSQIGVSSLRVGSANATARAEATLAVEQANANATAQIIAKQKTNITLAHQLANQAQIINLNSQTHLIQSTLLSIESLKRYPLLEADQALRRTLLYFPQQVLQIKANYIEDAIVISPNGRLLANGGELRDINSNSEPLYVSGSIKAFSPDEKWVVTTDGNTVRVLETATGQEIAHMTHNDIVNAVAFSPDSKWVVSGSSDHTARVWEATTGKEIARITHENIVDNVAFSPDGKWVASDGWGSLIVVDVATDQQISYITIPKDPYSNSNSSLGLAFSPDGKWIVTGSGNGTVHVWDIVTGKEISHMQAGGYVPEIVFSPNGEWVLSGQRSSGLIYIWEATTGREIAQMKHDDTVMATGFSPDGKWVISASRDKTCRVWEASTGLEIARMVYDAAVTSAFFMPDGKHILCASEDGNIRIWLPTNGSVVAHITNKDSLTAIALSSDGKRIVSGSTDNTVRVWELTTGSEVIHMTHDNNVTAVAFSSDGKWVASGSQDHTARIWDVSNGKEITRGTYNFDVTSVSFSANGQEVAFGGCDSEDDIGDCKKGSVHILQVTTWQEVSQININGDVTKLIFSPDGKWLATLSDNKQGLSHVQVWETDNGQGVADLKDIFSYAMVFSPDGKSPATASMDAAHVWGIPSGQEISHTNYDGSLGLAIAFSPDSKWVIIGIDNFDTRIWEVATGQEISSLSLDGQVLAVAFSPDGKTVISAGEDKIAHVWDAATGKEVARMTFDDIITWASFSIDGKYIITAGSDHAINVWLWHPEDLIAEACALLSRNFTQEEWKQYIGNEPYKPTCANLPISTK